MTASISQARNTNSTTTAAGTGTPRSVIHRPRTDSLQSIIIHDRIQTDIAINGYNQHFNLDHTDDNNRRRTTGQG